MRSDSAVMTLDSLDRTRNGSKVQQLQLPPTKYRCDDETLPPSDIHLCYSKIMARECRTSSSVFGGLSLRT